VNYKISRHAQQEMLRRQVPVRIVHDILENPAQKLTQPNGNVIYQSKIAFEAGKLYLVRVVSTSARHLP
jgi:hypothetical protein